MLSAPSSLLLFLVAGKASGEGRRAPRIPEYLRRPVLLTDDFVSDSRSRIRSAQMRIRISSRVCFGIWTAITGIVSFGVPPSQFREAVRAASFHTALFFVLDAVSATCPRRATRSCKRLLNLLERSSLAPSQPSTGTSAAIAAIAPIMRPLPDLLINAVYAPTHASAHSGYAAYDYASLRHARFLTRRPFFVAATVLFPFPRTTTSPSSMRHLSAALDYHRRRATPHTPDPDAQSVRTSSTTCSTAAMRKQIPLLRSTAPSSSPSALPPPCSPPSALPLDTRPVVHREYRDGRSSSAAPRSAFALAL
ncbi:hypothetical protein C8R45DRAFT_1189584 [Mycena sanguinolenta]|nr:hypothetical protein C8R45DRAFT_1189584 [Mycena sanguinolenta]